MRKRNLGKKKYRDRTAATAKACQMGNDMRHDRAGRTNERMQRKRNRNDEEEKFKSNLFMVTFHTMAQEFVLRMHRDIRLPP